VYSECTFLLSHFINIISMIFDSFHDVHSKQLRKSFWWTPGKCACSIWNDMCVTSGLENATLVACT